MLSTDIPDKTRASMVATPRQTRSRWRAWKRNITFYLFASPWILGFLLLTVFPLGYALWLGFTNFDGYTDPRWIGLQNYTNALFHDPAVWFGLRQTFLYTLLVVPIGVAGALLLALLLNRRLPAVGLWRTIFYLPAVVPIVGVALMFQMLFSQNTGIVNGVLSSFHISAVNWLGFGNGSQAFTVLVLLAVWGLGGGMIISLAGLQAVSTDLLEAATIDGAGAWMRFWRVTVPLLSPVLFFQVVTGVIAALQTLVQPMLLTPGYLGGGVGNSTTGIMVPQDNQLYMYHVYQIVFTEGRFGYGSALLWILFVAIMIFTLLILRSSSFWVYYEFAKEGDQ